MSNPVLVTRVVKTTSYKVGQAKKQSFWIEVPPEFKGMTITAILKEKKSEIPNV